MPVIPDWKLVVIPIPPINSFTSWPDFKRAEIEPISIILLNKSSEPFFSKVCGKISKAEIMIWINRRESRLLYQLLKNPSVVLFDIHKKANGAANTKSFISMYLRAKLVSIANTDIDSMLDNIPSKENMLKSDDEGALIEFFKDMKEISFFRISFPSSQ